MMLNPRPALKMPLLIWVFERGLRLFASFAGPGGFAMKKMFSPSAEAWGGDDEMRLLKEIADGNTFSFEKFYDATSGYVYGYCLKMAKSVPIASELMQEAYIKLWDERRHLREVAYPRAYLFRIASRCVYNYLTNSSKRQQILEIGEAANIVEAELHVHDQYEARELMEQIEAAVQKLPAQQQKVFRMSKYDGSSRNEIAEAMDISISAVDNYLNVALKKVRASLTEVAQ